MTARRRVYVAGPYSAPTPEAVRANILEAQLVGLAILEAGGLPLVPHALSAYVERRVPEPVWLQFGVDWLTECDGLVLLPRWPQSRGAIVERGIAAEERLPMWEAFPSPSMPHGWGLPDSLVRWLRGAAR